MRRAKSLLLAAVGGFASPAVQAQDTEAAAPDVAFLEYLGSWQEDDAEWLVVAEWEGENEPARPQADGKPETEEGDSDD